VNPNSTDPDELLPNSLRLTPESLPPAEVTEAPITLELDEEGTVAYVPPEPPPAPQPAAPRGEPFGDYELLRETGTDAAGTTYEARQVSLNRLVALTIIDPDLFRDEHDRAEFLAAGRAAARLEHPGVVRTFEVGTVDGRFFIATALPEGETLGEKLAERPLPGREAADVVRKLAEALHEAHKRGVRHGIITPARVWLGADGSVRLAGFGLGTLRVSSSRSGGDPDAGYRAPEQAGGGGEVGTLTDIYQLGAVLYAALTGQSPFRAARAGETLRQVRNSPPVHPTRLNPKAPRDLEAVCLVCLRKEPGKRYRSALDLTADLRRWLARKPVKARAAGPVRRALLWARRNQQAVALVAITLIVGLGPEIVAAARGVVEGRRAWEAVADPDADQPRRRAALRYFARESARRPNDPDLTAGLALAQYRAGKFKDAEATLRRLAPEPGAAFTPGERLAKADVQMLQALIALNTGKMRRADDWWPLDNLTTEYGPRGARLWLLHNELRRRWTDPEAQARWLNSSRVPVRKTALRALSLRLDPDEHAALVVERLSDPDEGVRSATASLLGKIPSAWWASPAAVPVAADLAEQLRTSSQTSAIVALLGHAGANARAAVPLLIQRVPARDGIDFAVNDALKKIDPDWARRLEARTLIEPLVLRLPAAGLSSEVGRILAAIDPTWSSSTEAKRAIPELVATRVRTAAAEAVLVKINPAWPTTPEAAAAVPAVLPHLESSDSYARAEAARLLGRIGPAARAARPALIERLPETFTGDATAAAPRVALDAIDPDWRLSGDARRAADLFHCRLVAALADANSRGYVPMLIDTLGEIGPVAAPAAGRLAEFLEWHEGYDAATVRFKSVVALGRIGPDATVAIPALRACLDRGGREGMEAFVSLTRIDPGWRNAAWGESAYGVLRCLASAAGGFDRLAAMEALRRVPGQDPARLAEVAAGALDGTEPVRLAGVKMLGEAGPAAKPFLPELLGRLADPDPNVRAAALTAIGKVDADWKNAPAVRKALVGFVGQLSNPNSTYQLGAANALGRLGPAAAPAFAALAERLTDHSEAVARAAAAALAEIDRDWAKAAPVRAMVPDLVFGLSDPRFETRRGAAAVLPLIDRDWAKLEAARGAVPRLTEALAIRGREVYAAEALGRFGPAAAPAMPKLRALLAGDHAPDIRRAGAASLGQVGPDALPAVAELVLVWAEVDAGRTNTPSFEALRKIDPEWARSAAARGLLPKLIPMLADARPERRAGAAVALQRIDAAWPATEEARQAIPALAVRLEAADDAIRAAAAEALGNIGPSATAAAPALVRCVADRAEGVRTGALAALERIDPQWAVRPEAREAVALLVPRVADADETIRRAAVATLGKIDPQWRTSEEVRKFLPALAGRLAAADSGARRGAAEAVAEIGAPAAPVAAALGQCALADAAADTRLAAVKAAARLGPAVKEAMPALVAALADEQQSVRTAAEEALKAVTPDWEGSALARKAIPELIERMARPLPEGGGRRGPPPPVVQQAALATLKRADPSWWKRAAAKRAIPGLVEKLTAPAWGQVAAAANVLDQIDDNWPAAPAAKAIVGPLKEALTAPDSRKRRAAAHALGRLGPAASDALPALEKLAKDSDREVAQEATGALWRIRPRQMP
jgi:HEAT repeat protein